MKGFKLGRIDPKAMKKSVFRLHEKIGTIGRNLFLSSVLK